MIKATKAMNRIVSVIWFCSADKDWPYAALLNLLLAIHVHYRNATIEFFL